MTQYFYDLGEGNVGHFVVHPLYEWVYQYGPQFALAVALISTILFFTSFFFIQRVRAASLFLLLTFFVGSVLITNIVLKDNWGRPRPRQVKVYGGDLSYRPFWKPNLLNQGQSEPAKSFPCGHATAGFYFLSLVFLGRRLKSRFIALSGWTLGLGLGILFGITRMAQGGHFFSDVLMSGIVMWYIGFFCDWAIFQSKQCGWKICYAGNKGS
ncbi:MAG: phosphatase PAP2 family protein [Waddliaceae bacterium]